MEINREASLLEETVKFAEDEIVIVKTALKTKLFRRDEPQEVRVGKFQVMLTALSDKFGIPEVRFERLEGDDIGAHFEPEGNKIVAQRYSLVSILMAFAVALMFHKNQGLAEGAEPVLSVSPIGFGLSAFKQAAPVMFETAKNAGRLCCVSVPYTDGGRIQPDSDDGGDDGDDGDGDDDGPSMRPDIDPENRIDRGNGPGED